MKDKPEDELSKKLNVLIALSIRRLLGDNDFASNSKRKKGIGDLVHYLDGFGIDAKDISQILGSPITSVRTLLTPTRRK